MNRNRFMRACAPALALGLTFAFSSMALAQKTGDRSDGAPTADQQKNNKSDLEITAEIRRAVMHDKTLSTDAHNVKIIAQKGVVTLKGPVRSEAEKTTIEQKAVAVVGQASVVNQIEVNP